MFSSDDFRKAASRIDAIDAEIFYLADYYSSADASRYFEKLKDDLQWQSVDISLFGKTHKIPRLQAFYGEPNLNYEYSGIKSSALPWTDVLLDIKQSIECSLQLSFNSVLCNLYRDGSDSNGWHADDEKELGVNPAIASLSFGETRDFQLKHKKTDQRIQLPLASGALLLMAGETQSNWQHCLPKRKRCVSPRINLTFRNIL